MKTPVVQLGVSLAVLVVVCILYGGWYAYVAHETARETSLQTSIDQESDTAARAAEAERTLVALGPREASTESHFVATGNVVSFLQDLQATGSHEGTTVTVGSVSEDTSPRPHLTISMTVAGSFDAVMRTLGVIEYGPYDIETSQATLTASSNGDAAGTWVATLTVSVGTLQNNGGSTEMFVNSSSTAPSVLTPPSSAATSTSNSTATTSGTKGSTPHPAV